MELRECVLPNGLEVIAECNPQAHSVALAFFVNAGARDELPATAGVSHFLEHMTFKGTPRRSAADVNRELDELGAHSNAYTSEEHTVYYATVLPEYQDATVDLLADIMRPSLRDEDFDTEKLVILEEIFKYDDQPPFGAHEKCMAACFPHHPLGNSILGTTESVSQLSVTAMRQYFRERYSPGNMKLVAAGRVDFDQLVSMAQQHCGDWEPVAASRTAPQSEIATGFKTITKPNAAQQYVVQISPGPAATHADRHAGRIVASMIGDDTGSRLFWELVDNGLAEYAGIGPYEFEDVGILMGFLCCSPDQAQDNVHRMADVIRRAEADGFTESELELAKNKICSQLVRQSERPTNRLFSVGTGWLQRGKYFTVKERLEAYQRVTLSDVHAFLENYPLSKNMSVAVGPLETLTAP